MASSAVYQQKRALIIGINKYPRDGDSLKYCINDATDFRNTLRHIGFETSFGSDCNLREFKTTIDEFVETIKVGDLVLFYFAGHGKQSGDENFLLPSDYDYNYLGHEYQYIADHAINVKYIIDKIDRKRCRITIYLFDCCRRKTKVQTRAIDENQGLAPIALELQSLVVFACAPNEAVLDETWNNRNGSFMENLLKHITTPDKDIEEIMKRVTVAVNQQTGGVQLPFRTSSLTHDVHLVTRNNQDRDKPLTNLPSRHRAVSSSIKAPINFLLIGEEGVGKSTFINAFANYLSSKTVEQAQANGLVVVKPLSFRMFIDDTFEERTCTFGHFDRSILSSCRTYTFDPHLTDGRKLCLIDTPSLVDAPGSDQSSANTIKHILDYVNQLSHLNAICFLLQPDASQLFKSFQSCFGQLMSRLGRNARENVIFCFTNALLTFSTPGSTARLLRNMFASYSMNDILFSRDNSFFFENESFRYLVAVENGTRFTHEEKSEYTASWSESVDESNRLLSYIRQRPIYQIVKR